MNPLLGFAPSADPTAPGVLTDCTNVVPTETGIKGAPAATSIGIAALSAACAGAASVSDLSGSRRLYAGTASGLYELSGASWTDRSGATYTLSSDDVWTFAQMGDATLAAAPGEVIQRSTGGAFGSISGAPQARCVAVAAGFAMAWNTDASADTWHCSALYVDTDWTEDVETQSASGRLIGGSGPGTALMRFQSELIAYKSGACFRGAYSGPPEIWRWQEVSTDIGCVGPLAVVDTPLGHVFLGRDGLWYFDGTTPRPLPDSEAVRDWFFKDVSHTYLSKAQLLWDRSSARIWIFYPRSNSTGELNGCMVYHLPSRRFGLAHQTIESIVHYTTPALTYTVLGTTAPYSAWTYADIPTGVSYESPFWTAGTTNPAIFNSSHVLQTLTGQTATSDFTTGDFGVDGAYSFCNTLRVRYQTEPTTSTATGYSKDRSGMTVTTEDSNVSADGKHPMRQRARWHRFKVAQTGDWTASGVEPSLQVAGRR